MPKNEIESEWEKLGRTVTNAEEEPHKVADRVRHEQNMQRIARRNQKAFRPVNSNILPGSEQPDITPTRPLKRKLDDRGLGDVKSAG